MLAADGIASLVLATEGRGVEHGVARLEEVVARSPRDARALSDLAAAYEVRARSLDAPWDLIRALGRAHQALTVDPTRVEAQFNLALALETLHLRNAANTAWEGYLRLDSGTPWADEARRHLRAAASRPAAAPVDLLGTARRIDRSALRDAVARDPQAARLLVEDGLLPRWAGLVRAAREVEAAQVLESARAIGEALAASGGDTLLLETTEALAQSSDTDPPRRQLEISGIESYRLGMTAYRGDATRDSRVHLASAARSLRMAGNPFSSVPEVYLAILDYHTRGPVEALTKLERLGFDPAQRQHHSLLGRLWWTAGLCHEALGHSIESMAAFRRALAELTATGDLESRAAVQSLLGGVLDDAGEHDAAWHWRLAALAGLDETHAARRRHTILGAASLSALRLGEVAAARDFQDEAVAAARQSGRPLDIVEALRARAEVSLEDGRAEEALVDLRQASALDSQLEEQLHESVAAKLQEVEGLALRDRDPQRAISALRAAITLFRANGFLSEVPAANLELAAAELAAGSRLAAQGALEEGIKEEEEELRHLVRHLEERRAGDVWSNYFKKRRQLFDALISTLAAAGNPSGAFAAAERASSWEFLLQLLQVPVLPPGALPATELERVSSVPQDLARQLPRGTALVEYRMLDDHLLVWVVRRELTRATSVGVRRAALAEITARLRAGPASSNEPELEGLSALYSWLIEPVARDLVGAQDLIFVPDRDLYGVPFAALWNRRLRRFLVEDFAVGIAPSAEQYLACVRRAHSLAPTRAPSALVAWNPAFDQELFPQLPPLAGTEAEGRRIASLYPKSEAISGKALTRERLLEGLSQHEVVHFGGHAVGSAANPLASALPLAPSKERGSSGVLYAYELFGRHLARTRLVVLAACDTAAGGRMNADQITGFVRPLLGDGVPAVVASLWEADDRATERLFTVFHQRVRAGEIALHALHQAQLTLLREDGGAPMSFRQWAAFEVFGGEEGGGE
jgi:CHAT domain-containing protein